MNKVIKVVTMENVVYFIIQTEGDTDFWYWEIPTESWLDYWNKLGNPAKAVQAALGYNPERCDEFANDPNNDTVGASCGSFATVEDAIADIWG